MRVQLLICTVFLTTNVALAEQVETAEIVVEPSQAIVQVNGIVCSFCAYGAEKNLSKLEFLDDSKFGGDGVLIDIRSHRITLALRPEQNFDLAEVYKAITKGGYDPVSFHVSLQGRVRQDGDRYLLTSTESGQVFEIIGDNTERLIGRDFVRVTGRVDVADVADLKADQPTPVRISSIDQT